MLWEDFLQTTQTSLGLGWFLPSTGEGNIATFYCDGKDECTASLLQSSVSHDPSEIILICWFAVQDTFLIIINVENSCAASYFFCGNGDHFFQGSLINIQLKRTVFVWNISLIKEDLNGQKSFPVALRGINATEAVKTVEEAMTLHKNFPDIMAGFDFVSIWWAYCWNTQFVNKLWRKHLLL